MIVRLAVSSGSHEKTFFPPFSPFFDFLVFFRQSRRTREGCQIRDFRLSSFSMSFFSFTLFFCTMEIFRNVLFFKNYFMETVWQDFFLGIEKLKTRHVMNWNNVYQLFLNFCTKTFVLIFPLKLAPKFEKKVVKRRFNAKFPIMTK